MKTSKKATVGFAAIAVLVTLAAIAQTGRTYSVKTMPPSVIKTVPAAGATDVDPNLKEITVTFSKDMMDQSWSIPTSTPPENYPEDGGGKIHYQPDKRTCVFPVKLHPGRSYVIWFNDYKFRNFKDTEGRSSVPYLLVFQTRP